MVNALRGRCEELNIHSSNRNPGSPSHKPQQSGRIESFNSSLRDDQLNRGVVDSMREIRFVLVEHRIRYNHCRPKFSVFSPDSGRVRRQIVHRKQFGSPLSSGLTKQAKDNCAISTGSP